VEINQKVLQLVTDLANHRNIKEVGSFLEGEIRKAKKMTDGTSSKNKKAIEDADATEGKKASGELTSSSSNEYRYMLIKCIS